MGLSLRGVSTALAAFGVSLSHISVWRDNQEQSELLAKQRRWQGVRVLGLDGACPLGWGKKRPVLIAVDLGNGVPVAIGQVDECNPQAVRRWVSNALRELQAVLAQEWQWVLEEIRRLLAELPPEGSRCLFELWKQVPERRTGQAGARSPLEQLRHLLIRLIEHWDSYRVFDWQPDVP